MNVWDVWFADFPYEENPSIVKKRPVIVLDINTGEVLSVKVTSHSIRNSDPYDVPIQDWHEAGLSFPSVSRVGKTIYLSKDRFDFKIGSITQKDRQTITEKFVEFIKNKKNQ